MIKILPHSLQGRLTLALLVSFFLIGAFSIYLLALSSSSYQRETTQIMHKDLAEHVAHHYTFDEQGVINYDKIKHVFHELMILGPNFEFYVLDNSGKILAFSAEKKKVKRESISIAPIKSFLNTKNIDSPIYGQDPRSTTRKKVFSASPIVKDGQQLGYIYVILGSEIYDKISDLLYESKIVRWGIGLTITALFFGFLATLWITGMITRPLNTLSSQIREIHHEGFTKENVQNTQKLGTLQNWDKNHPNDIHMLGHSFNQLMDKLSEQYEKVVTIDELRQELLSHISHDLRTPLVSMLGYLETWELQQDKLSKEESHHYIRTAKNNAKKISVLIEQLFELAHLDSDNIQVNKERFALAELVQDVLVKFDIEAKAKGIELKVTPKDAAITVLGDIEKLERVFTNLIENAIRHTEENGKITVRLNKDSRFVSVEVIDTGIGIPEQDLPKVFEPHYKAGNSVRENTAHGGLGLAITKKLLSLHQSSIEVTSKINEGTTFTFSLQSAANT